MSSRASFTLIELLVVIAILAVLATAVVLVLNPAEMLKAARDSTRLSDLAALNTAFGTLQADNESASFGTANIIYTSLPDSTTTCANLGLPTLPTNWSYRCVPTSTLTKTDGTGWIPVDFTQFSGGTVLAKLPVDPVNTTSSNQFYTYIKGSWKFSAKLESQKYLAQAQTDKGTDATRYETGSDVSCGNLVADYEGNLYPTVQIGTQCWLGANLRTKYKPDGTLLTNSIAGSVVVGSERSCPGAHNTTTPGTETDCNTYGALYTWTATMNGTTTEGAQGVCPTGWHVPTDTEQNTLDQYLTDLGQTCDANRVNTTDCSTAGTKLKSGGSSGFNGIYAGDRHNDGSMFAYRGIYGFFWSSTPPMGGNAWTRNLINSTGVRRWSYPAVYSLSLRCLKN